MGKQLAERLMSQGEIIYHILSSNPQPPSQKTGICNYCKEATVWTEKEGWIHAESGKRDSNSPFLHGALVSYIGLRPGGEMVQMASVSTVNEAIKRLGE